VAEVTTIRVVEVSTIRVSGWIKKGSRMFVADLYPIR